MKDQGRSSRMLVASVAVLSLLLSACGGGGDDGSAASGENESGQEGEPAAEAEEPTGEAGPETGAEPLDASEPTAVAAEYLSDLDLEMDALGDLDTQLDVPQEWLDSAQEEGTVRLRGDFDVEVYAPVEEAFEERYPFIDVELFYASTMEKRATQTITAFKQGESMTDVLGGASQHLVEMKEIGMLEDLSDLPVWPSVPEGAKGVDGEWLGWALKFWSICYNTNALELEELPETWDEALEAPAFRDGLATADRPQLWLYALAAEYGDEWAENFMDEFFNTLQPIQRSEGMGALPQLLANGNFDALLPCASYTTERLANEGAPVAWYSPEPIPVNVSDVYMMSNAENPYSAKIYLNWLASTEGQLVSSVAENVSPVNESMRSIEALYPYAEQKLNLDWTMVEAGKREEYAQTLGASWSDYWVGGEG